MLRVAINTLNTVVTRAAPMRGLLRCDSGDSEGLA